MKSTVDLVACSLSDQTTFPVVSGVSGATIKGGVGQTFRYQSQVTFSGATTSGSGHTPIEAWAPFFPGSFVPYVLTWVSVQLLSVSPGTSTGGNSLYVNLYAGGLGGIQLTNSATWGGIATWNASTSKSFTSMSAEPNSSTVGGTISLGYYYNLNGSQYVAMATAGSLPIYVDVFSNGGSPPFTGIGGSFIVNIVGYPLG